VPNGRTGGEWHARRARSRFGDRAVAEPWPRAEINAKITTALPVTSYAAGAAFGNTATRLDAFVAAGGRFTFGSYPDIEGLIREQASELDRSKREAIRHRIQQLMHEKVMFALIMETASPSGFGPRVVESGLGMIPNMAASAPYEDLSLKGK
jgi:ABC-type transport system substrate-binding protein